MAPTGFRFNAQLEYMNVVILVTYTGTADSDDALAARHAVFIENRTRAAATPPGTPLPFSTPAELKASYLIVLGQAVTKFHLESTVAAKSEAGISQRFTLAQVAQINANLVARLNAGEAAATIVTDTAA